MNWITKANTRDSRLRLQDREANYLPEEFETDSLQDDSYNLDLQGDNLDLGGIFDSLSIMEDINGFVPKDHSLL